MAEFGRNWLGIDAETHIVLKAPSQFVDSPRHYGFHATLKAPMRLANGRTYCEFAKAVSLLARSLGKVDLGVLNLTRIGSFLALTLDNALHDEASKLAWKCVEELDEYRASLSQAERDRRTGLSVAQMTNLEKWGYPYVGNEFKFHMTLTSSLSEDQFLPATQQLSELIPAENVILDSICIFGDPGNLKPFALVERFDLTGEPQQK